MYTLAAVITESLGGRPWEDMVRESIFTPLGMNRSTFVTQADFGDNVALPMCSESGVGLVKCSLDFIRHWGSFIGSGNVFSSARDMSQWLLCLLNDGTAADGRRVLAQGLVDTLHKPQNTIPLSSYAKYYMKPVTPQTFSGDTYGLGWRLGYYRGYRTAHHSGSTYGYDSYITLLRDENIGIFSTATGSDNNFEFRTALHTSWQT
ncbi:uncharacterized protein LOC112570594 [Pomacea canaliculata]|uniref:uncharacterized protein LOC112570594 n=1 Tax=Pomacea canaliculata TaxID=400727 RepID=UPI000D739301|nr:uncharacterized protein LOC112570594 [Pomacea canaliculata]XP_025104900.1 uncharacterized protein LOC112570594 [Pomacea canaliculata]